MGTRDHYDVIFAGGGIMGCAIAYNLLRRDPNLKILLVERNSTYATSSTVLSDGNIRVQFNLRANIEMSLYGLEVLSTFSEEFATEDHVPDIGFRQQGNLYLVDAEGEDFARNGLAIQRSLGADVVWVERGEITDLFPLYRLTDDVVGATYGRKDGTMSPLDVLLGIRRKAVSLGARIVEDEVTRLLRSGNQMTGIEVASGDVYSSNIVFNVTGAWAPLLADPLGIDLQMLPIKREVYNVQINRSSDRILPMLLLPNGQYLFHEGAGNFEVGGAQPNDPVTYDDFSYSRTNFEEFMWEGFVKYLPDFDRLKIVSGWGGLYAMNTLDYNAILGEWPTLKGYYCANGFSGHGFQQCFAVGRYLAEMVLGEEHALDLSIFSPQRILDNKPVYENPARLI
ncbi:MAG: NAD(P)/FAD-dependent oxidoreductase [Candidatus Promineifilaceae bacterium]|jgi:FAD-dependent oxidoreductase domain-containing protein 1